MINMNINKFAIICCIVALLTSASFVVSYADEFQDDNLIADSDIENADNGFCNPYIGNFLGITTEKAHSGEKSVKTKVPSSWAHLVQIKPTAGLVPGKKYIMSFWYYTDVEYVSARLITVLNNGSAITSGMTQSPVVTGKWTKYTCIFTAQEGTEQINYIYPAVVNGSPYSADNIMYFDDFALRAIPDNRTVLESAAVDDNSADNARFSFVYSGQPEIFDIENALSLNGAKLSDDDVLLDMTYENGKYKVTVTLKKQLIPNASYDLEIDEINDVYGIKIDKNDFNKVTFTTPPDVDVDGFYYKTADNGKTPVSGVVSENISFSYKLKNNTSSDKHCYLVYMLARGNNIVKVLGVSEETVTSDSPTAENTFVLGEIPAGCYVRTFCWTSLDANRPMAFNEIIELK